jgi:hypothetical protein
MSTTAAEVPPHAKKGPRWSRQSGAGYTAAPEKISGTTNPEEDERAKVAARAPGRRPKGPGHQRPRHARMRPCLEAC